ncbi:hypothetical protein M407DRAFT_154178 [Tulasnella calospora MUT 4182]|uniref:Uncharacterized protein n=1 Tax=Tulasnella calospora MUT 4182 TaxID=1051891 RepID=A0A0C3QQ04_9AGAM|nr:hypothetical protein M407DRAFT_154178 [Tulasnella calospora MUT 4182]
MDRRSGKSEIKLGVSMVDADDVNLVDVVVITARIEEGARTENNCTAHLFDGRRAHGMMTRVLQSVGEVLLRALNARRLGHPGQTNQARPPREGRTNSGFVVRV